MRTRALTPSYSTSIGIYIVCLLHQSILSFYSKILYRFDDEGVHEERETSLASQPLSKPPSRASRISSLRRIPSLRIDPPGENHQHSSTYYRRNVDVDVDVDVDVAEDVEGDVEGDVDVEQAVVNLAVVNLPVAKDVEGDVRVPKKQDDQYVDF
ncbi:hypothetical protein N7471_004583 [Penicillium samsonianum]|uniref:uncharacterized protein n=1 Tax=Penicillium samsonianum TaxID=1882272 RepID=UPI002548A532|nr:uncharacterized protein N7471_004583 [Penicillium samsonianum]KAJ6138097.1 hypothetical protein N7471_004583 [Penicillium samsonianum]